MDNRPAEWAGEGIDPAQIDGFPEGVTEAVERHRSALLELTGTLSAAGYPKDEIDYIAARATDHFARGLDRHLSGGSAQR